MLQRSVYISYIISIYCKRTADLCYLLLCVCVFLYSDQAHTSEGILQNIDLQLPNVSSNPRHPVHHGNRTFASKPSSFAARHIPHPSA